MTTAADIGYSATFAIYNGSTYDAVAEVNNISLSGSSRDAVDATHMTSADSFREYIAGLMDAGEVSITLAHQSGTLEDLKAAQIAGVGQFKVTEPDTSTLVFSAVVTSVSTTYPLDDKMMTEATFKITGKPTYTAA